MKDNVSPKGGVQSVEVTLRVLLAVADGPGPRSLTAIANSAGLAASSTHRHLVTLVHAGMVEQESETGRYDLGSQVVDLGLKALARRDPVRLIGHALQDLRDHLDRNVFLAVWGNLGPTIVRREEATHAVTVNVRIGSVLPLLRSATGRVFLTWMPPASTAALISKEMGSLEQVENLRRTTLEHGLGSVHGDLLVGVASLSAPVFGHQGDLVAAISALGPDAEFDTNPEGVIAKTLKDAAQNLSKRLGFKL